ncbi:luciferase-like monooxygenase [Nitrospirillum viridazoti]|nr:luciferase-like monooxygenase [Nitrospirillum amazonense]
MFLDKTKQHALNHKGRFFSVAGPLALTRSPQGQPVIFQAGDSDAGRDLGATIADATFASADGFEAAQAYYADLKARAAAQGRNPDHIVVLPGLTVTIADTQEEADRLAAAHEAELDLDKLLVQLGRPFNYHDFRLYDLDAPFPDLSHVSLNGYKGHAERIIKTAREEGLTLREAAWRFGRWRSGFVGTPEAVADEIERWFTGRAADGFNIHVTKPGAFAQFTDKVVPILQRRGLFRADYTARTLRGHLGLPIPANRYSGRLAQVAE